MGSFGGDVGRADALQVDVEHLDNISSYLSILVDAVYDDLVPQVDEAHRLATVGGDVDASTIGAGGRSALGAGYTEVQELARRETSTYQALHDGLRGAADDLRKASQAITRIAEQYRTSEERNSLNATAFTQALGS